MNLKSQFAAWSLLAVLASAAPQIAPAPPEIPPKGVPGLVCQTPSRTSPIIEDCVKAFESIPQSTNPPSGPLHCPTVFLTWKVWATFGTCQIAVWSTRGDAHCIQNKERTALPAIKSVIDGCADPAQDRVEGYASFGIGAADTGDRGVWVYGSANPPSGSPA